MSWPPLPPSTLPAPPPRPGPPVWGKPFKGLAPTYPFPSDIASSLHLPHFPLLLSLHAGRHPRVPDEAIYSEAFRFALAFVRCPASSVASKERLMGWLAGIITYLFNTQLLAVLPTHEGTHQCCDAGKAGSVPGDEEIILLLESHIQTASDAVHRTYDERLLEWAALNKYVARLAGQVATDSDCPPLSPKSSPTSSTRSTPTSPKSTPMSLSTPSPVTTPSTSYIETLSLCSRDDK